MTEAASPSDTTINRKDRRRGRRFRQLVLIALILVLTALGVWLYLLYHSTPAYWLENQQFLERTRPEELNAMAHDLEVQVLRLQSYKGPLPGHAPAPDRGTEPPVEAKNRIAAAKNERTIRMSVAQANAWLATKLPKWLAHQNWQMPDQISRPMIHVEDNNLVLGFKWDSPEISNVFSIVLGVSMTEDGMVRIQRKTIRWGQLPVPYEFLVKHLHKRSSARKRRVVEWITQMSDGTPQTPVFPHAGDGTNSTRLRLLDLRLENDQIEVTLRVEPIEAGGASAPSPWRTLPR